MSRRGLASGLALRGLALFGLALVWLTEIRRWLEEPTSFPSLPVASLSLASAL